MLSSLSSGSISINIHNYFIWVTQNLICDKHMRGQLASYWLWPLYLDSPEPQNYIKCSTWSHTWYQSKWASSLACSCKSCGNYQGLATERLCEMLFVLKQWYSAGWQNYWSVCVATGGSSPHFHYQTLYWLLSFYNTKYHSNYGSALWPLCLYFYTSMNMPLFPYNIATWKIINFQTIYRKYPIISGNNR